MEGLTVIHVSLVFRFFKCLPFRVRLAYSSETWLYDYYMLSLVMLLFG